MNGRGCSFREPTGHRLSNHNNVNNNKNKYLDFFWSHQRKKVKRVCGGPREGASLVSSPPPGPETGPGGLAGKSGPHPAASGQGVGGAGAAGRPLKASGEGHGGRPVQTPCLERRRKIAVCPQFAVARKQRRGGCGSRPRLQVPWCYRPEFNRTEGRQAWRLWGAWRKSERGISRARMRYTTALGPWWQGHTYWPPGRQHRGRGATVAGMGAPPDRGAALPRPASAPT